MNGALLVVLALLWAVMLLPGAIRSRRSSLKSSVGGFHRAMESLRDHPRSGSAGGRTVVVPREPERIAHGPQRPGTPFQRAGAGASRGGSNGTSNGTSPSRQASPGSVLVRRRQVFICLLGTTAVTLVGAVVLGGAGWLALGISTVLLGGYTALLRRWKRERDQAREVVRDLHGPAVRPAGRDRAVGDRAVGDRAVGDRAVGEGGGSTGNVRVHDGRALR